MGIKVEDKTHTFRTPDGKVGNYDLRRAPPVGGRPPADERPHSDRQRDSGSRQPLWGSGSSAHRRVSPERSSAREREMAFQPSRRGPDRTPARRHSPPPARQEPEASKNTLKGFCHVLQFCMDREQARKKKDYRRSDEMRDEMKRMGVNITDSTHTFDFNGFQGCYDLSQPLGIHEAQYVALEREQARRHKLYDDSDNLRTWLTQRGVSLDDHTHMFTMKDGKQGSYDLHRWEATDG